MSANEPKVRDLPLAAYVRVNGILWCCQLVRRNAGPTFVCAKCKQGIVARADDVRKKCRVCGSKITVQYRVTKDICEVCGGEIRYRFSRWWHVESQDGFGPDKLVEANHGE